MATAPQFDLKGHLLSLYGLSRESTMMARFFDSNGEVIADREVTADECWSASGACWSNFMLADGKSARAVGAASVCFILGGQEDKLRLHVNDLSSKTDSGDEMAQPQTDLATGFESQICSRCGGCGRYSFNQMDRDMCYGCRGSGLVFTKRGSVARQNFQDSILTVAGDVKAGWIARGNNGKWFLVVSVEPYQMRGASLTNGVMVPYDRPGVDVTYGKAGHVQDVTVMIPAQPNIEAVAAFRMAALVYQQTLTQAGTVRKIVA